MLSGNTETRIAVTYDDKTMMFLGDAKDCVEDLIKAVEEL